MVRARIAGALWLAALPALGDEPGAARPAPAAELPMDGRARGAVSGAHEQAQEPEELRALREWELETFPLAAAPAAPPPLPADLASQLGARPRSGPGTPPDALTTRVRRDSGPVAQGAARPLSLDGLQMPDLPFRWDENVVHYLSFWRDDPRGHAIMAAWLKRLGRYAPMIRRVLRAEGLPEDLVYVAMIESSYDPTARSSVGAVGLWQLMPRAGEIYGLEQSHWVDERRHPERSTRAAAAFLRDLHRRFGDWDLVLAAYHMGYGALLNSIRKYNCNDYWQLGRIEAGLPYETTFYVPKILAAALVGRNPARFGFGDLRPDPERAAEVVEVPASVDVATLARVAGTTRDEMALYNPHLLRGRTPPVAGAYRVLVPAGKASAVLAALPRLRPEMRRWQRAVARFGETLASLAHRFRTTVRALAELNGVEEDARVEAGTVLLVPAGETPRADETAAEPVVVSVPPRHFAYADRRRIFYPVRRGDDARSVAAFFGVGTEDLRQWNAIEPQARLQEGMVLQLFVPRSVDLTRAVVLAERQVRILVQGTDEFLDWSEAQRGRRRIRYTVQAGDTLESIARRFELSIGSIARINRFERDVMIEPGRTIVVYAPPAAAAAAGSIRAPVIAAEDTATAPVDPAAPPAADAAAAAAASPPTPAAGDDHAVRGGSPGPGPGADSPPAP